MTVPSDRTADQLDAWLETASQRQSRPSSPNGATDPAAYDLVTTAHEFHGRMNAAEQRAMPEIPANAIWEDVMSSTTAGTISIPALAPSGAGSPPKAPTRPTADSTRPNPGHWAVPAFLVIALMIGILWFYSSFFGSTDPGPTPTSQPGFAFSTPTDDTNEWLVPLEDVDCGSPGTPYSSSPGFDLRQSISASIDVDAYLPFAEAPALEQRQIAERYLHLFAACPRASTDPGVTDDAFMMAFEYATDQQIAAARQISAALPIQNYREYFILQPVADTAGEDRRLNRTVALPGDVIQLADGRLGVPARFYLIGQDSVLDVTGGREYATTMFLVFDRVDGHWLVDEMIQVCIGDCDEYWAVLAGDLPADILATPIASPADFPAATEAPVDPAFLEPVTRSDCDVAPRSLQEIGAYQVDPGESVPRVYGPIAPVSDAEAIALYESGFTWEACEVFGDAGQKQAVLSPRHIFEGRHDSIARNSASVEEYIANNQALAATLLDPNRTNYTAFSSQEIPVNAQATPAAIDSWFGYRVLPQDVVQFPDGRMGGPLTDILPANYHEYREETFAETNQPTPTSYEFTLVEYVIFAEHDGQWLLDERFILCAADCDQWWAQAESFLQQSRSLVHTPTPIVLSATPFASPVATQATPDSALQPITPSECSVVGLSQDEISAIIRSTTEPLDRSWVPVGPVDPATAAEISRIDRAWQACDAFGSIGQRTVLQTDYLTSTGPEQSFDQASTEEALLLWLDRFDQRRDLGDSVFASIDTYLADAQLVFDTHGTGETLPFDQRISLPAPDTAILLADGRIALPIIDPYILFSWERAQSSESPGQFLYLPVHILALDADTNSWLVDEVISLCVGDCDTALALVQDVLDFYDIDSSPSTPQDSPVATPSSDDNAQWLVNRDDIDCERNENSLPDTFVTPDGTIAIGDYLPFAEADPEMQVAVARQFQLLAANCTSSPGGTPLISEDMSVFPGPSQRPVSQEQLDFVIALSDAVSTGDPLDFILEAEPGLVPSNGFEAETATLGIVFPESVVQLPDGRYGAPLHLAIESTDPAGTREMLDERGWITTTFHIFTVENGVIQLDEVVWICLGDCDDYWASYNIAQSPTASPAASPVATPVASPIATPASARTIRFS